ncbi:unnamed protein product [Ambrosiozyma monospora]|uniref:Unnamed protein product n=1 Tax=Ambrosiozyma monospora TaxID=43982 RepID=A0A9W7DJH2_AMBMO|nr:unnamed protein product [Ambrosiozyma monospora]
MVSSKRLWSLMIIRRLKRALFKLSKWIAKFLRRPIVKTQDSRLKTQDSRLKTQDSRLKTQDSRLKTQDSRQGILHTAAHVSPMSMKSIQFQDIERHLTTRVQFVTYDMNDMNDNDIA